MRGKKIFTILGGSSVWTPYLIRELAAYDIFRDMQIRLLGVTGAHLREVVDFSRGFPGGPLRIKAVVDVAEAIQGASVILNQVRIGGWASRLEDEMFPVKMGGVGDESLGVGGLTAALRTRPFIRHVSRTILQKAGDAWLLNLTNPSDLVSRGWYEAGCHRVISLCDYPQSQARKMAVPAGKPETASQFGFMGMTHVGWFIPPVGFQPDSQELESWYREWGAVPTAWRIRMADPEPFIREQQLHPGVRARKLEKLVAHLRAAIGKKDREAYLELLEERKPLWYGEVVIPALRGLLGEKPARLIVGLPNKGRLPGMPDNVIVENWAVINSGGAHPEPFPENPRCQKDITDFGMLRHLAFNLMLHPERRSLDSYVRSDPFARPIVSQGNLNRLLDEWPVKQE